MPADGRWDLTLRLTVENSQLPFHTVVFLRPVPLLSPLFR